MEAWTAEAREVEGRAGVARAAAEERRRQAAAAASRIVVIVVVVVVVGGGGGGGVIGGEGGGGEHGGGGGCSAAATAVRKAAAAASPPSAAASASALASTGWRRGPTACQADTPWQEESNLRATGPDARNRTSDPDSRVLPGRTTIGRENAGPVPGRATP